MRFDSPILFDEALRIAEDKGVMPTNLGSDELRQLKAEIRRRAVFSARLDRERVLDVIKQNLELIAGGGRDEYGRLRSIPEAKAQIKEAMRKSGLPPAPDGTPKLQDFYSGGRRQLIVETQVLDTLNHGRWKATQDPDILDVNPAWELVRMVQPSTGRKRNWRRRWEQALASTGSSVGATDGRSGRMVALKNHPIWQALGDGAGGYRDTLGNPWPPFAFNSGMNVVDVTRKDAESLGILTPGKRIQPQTDPGWAENARVMERNEMHVENERRMYVRDDDGQFAREGGAPKREAKQAEKKAIGEDRKKIAAVLRKGRVKSTTIEDPKGKPIRVEHGTPGEKQAEPPRKGGHGISHILAHRDRNKKTVAKVPETVRKGERNTHTKAQKTEITHGSHVVVISESRKRKLITAIDKRKKRGSRSANESPTTKVVGVAAHHLPPTQGGLPFSGTSLVASKDCIVTPRAANVQALCRAVSKRAVA